MLINIGSILISFSTIEKAYLLVSVKKLELLHPNLGSLDIIFVNEQLL